MSVLKEVRYQALWMERRGLLPTGVLLTEAQANEIAASVGFTGLLDPAAALMVDGLRIVLTSSGVETPQMLFRHTEVLS